MRDIDEEAAYASKRARLKFLRDRVDAWLSRADEIEVKEMPTLRRCTGTLGKRPEEPDGGLIISIIIPKFREAGPSFFPVEDDGWDVTQPKD